MMIRNPAVAGPFYSASAATLAAEVAGYLDSSAQPEPIIAAISPHAGLMYSGPVAGSVYGRVAVPAPRRLFYLLTVARSVATRAFHRSSRLTLNRLDSVAEPMVIGDSPSRFSRKISARWIP